MQEKVEDPEFAKALANVFDVTILKEGDSVFYSTFEPPSYSETGVVKSDNPHKEGVTVHGDGWKQYVSMWQIMKVERNGELLYSNMPGQEKVFKGY